MKPLHFEYLNLLGIKQIILGDRTFDIVVFKQSRVLLSLGLFGCLLPTILLLSVYLESAYLRLIAIVFGGLLLIVILAYYCTARLLISDLDGNLIFNWKSKIVFNYRKIQPISMSNVKKIVVDQDQILRKIVYNSGEINLSSLRANWFIKSDSEVFINYMRKENAQVEVLDSWDEWARKGYLKTAYRVNTGILIISFIVVTLYSIIKGINSYHFLVLIFVIPQLLLYQMQMKRKTRIFDGEPNDYKPRTYLKVKK